MPRQPAPLPKMPLRPPPSLEELLFVAILALAGFGLRIAHPERMAVEHFDEGVYTADLWFVEDARYPDRYLYAPPLLPALASWSMALLGPSHLGTMLVSLLAGTLTVAAAWWLARSWFGTEAGLTAGVLAALSDFHILYSRTALTDVLLGLWLLLAVHFLWRALTSRSPLAVFAAGVFTGLAWWTKYNGWLPLAIGLAALIPWLLLHRPRRESIWKPLTAWLAIAGIAAVVWSPVWFQIRSENPDGYAAVAANHARYVVGLTGWWHSFIAQFGNHRLLNGGLGVLSIALAILASAAAPLLDFENQTAEPRPKKSPAPPTMRRPARYVPAIALALLLAALSAVVGTTIILGVLATAGIALQLWNVHRTDPAQRSKETSLAAWLLTAWFVGLLVATPFYRPYPRLSLPWLIAAWLGTAALVGWHAERSRSLLSANRSRVFGMPALLGCIVIAAGLILWSGERLLARGVPGWQPRTGLESISTQIIADADRVTETSLREPFADVPYVAYVYAEPALVFHLTAAGLVAQPAGNLGFVNLASGQPQVPTFLVTGPHAHRSQQFKEEWSRVSNRFELIATYRYEPSTFVLLNHYPPPAVASKKVPPHEVRLYRVR